MQPGSGENQVNFELPQTPQGELVEDKSLEELPTKSPENRPQGQSVQASSAAASSIALPSNTVAGMLNDDGSAQTQASSTIPHATAKDTDRIEKVWVDKAKAIISKTKDDPFEQKHEISRVKAEYIKNRFNKTIKADDAVAK